MSEGTFEAPARRVVTIRYTGALSGLVVVMHRAGRVHLELAAKVMGLSDGPDITLKDAEILGELFEEFAKALISWNLTNKGEPVEPTVKGISSQDDDFMFDVIIGWLASVSGGGSTLQKEISDAVESREDEELLETLEVSPIMGSALVE